VGVAPIKMSRLNKKYSQRTDLYKLHSEISTFCKNFQLEKLSPLVLCTTGEISTIIYKKTHYLQIKAFFIKTRTKAYGFLFFFHCR